MPNSFAGYGEQSNWPLSPWCEEISLSEIEQRASICSENFQCPDKVYLSNDLYADLLKQMAHSYGAHGYKAGMHIMTINTCVGLLKVIQVPGLHNFCLVGTEDDYNLVERTRIDKAFEEIVFDGEDNVYWRSTSQDNELPVSTEVPRVDKPTNN